MWLVCINKVVIPLASATPRQARRSPRQELPPPPFKTRHLGVEDEFYHDPSKVEAAAALRQPKTMLPKYADLVYKIVLRALPLRAYLPFIDDADRTCSFCNSRETYSHLFVDCDFVQDVWASLAPAFEPLGVQLPEKLHEFIFASPSTTPRAHQDAFDTLWPLLRACVWFHVWRARNDSTFRPDLPQASPWAVAHKAARVVQLHLHHAVAQDPEPEAKLRLLRTLQESEWARQHIVPTNVT